MRRRVVLVGLAATGATVLLGGCAKTPLPTVADLLGRWESKDGASITFTDARHCLVDRLPRYAFDGESAPADGRGGRDRVGGPCTWSLGDVLGHQRDNLGRPILGILREPSPQPGVPGGFGLFYGIDRHGPVLFWTLGDPDDDKFYSLRKVRGA